MAIIHFHVSLPKGKPMEIQPTTMSFSPPASLIHRARAPGKASQTGRCAWPRRPSTAPNESRPCASADGKG